MKTSIVIATYNHCSDLLKPCLSSIQKYTNLDETEIIVVANGCKDETKEYVESLGKSFKLLWFDNAIGFTAATNAGIKEAAGDYIILLNNDTVLLEQPKNQWIDMLTDPFKNPKVGVTGPMLVHCPYANRQFLIFFCVCIKKELFDKIGLLDTIFSPGFGEDSDFCIKAQNLGYELAQVPYHSDTYDHGTKVMLGGFPIWHKGEGTFSSYPEGEKLLAERRFILMNRYNDNIKLNLGCGDKKISGFFNIDLSAPGADLQWDCKKIPLDDNKVDEIMAIHLLEHFAPEEVTNILKEWYRILKPNGKLILEMPDIQELCNHFKDSEKKDKYTLINCIYGSGTPACTHKYGWYPEILYDHLNGVGFKNIQFMYPKFEHWGYNFRAECIKQEMITINKKSKVYDCFTFCNELDQLEIRLNELDSVVDYFVLAEGTETHSGLPKPLYFQENKQRFEKFLSKIRHIIVDQWPKYIKDNSESAWIRERMQRDVLIQGLTDAQPDDIFIFGDVDEIPRASALKEYKGNPVSLEMNLYYYYLNSILDNGKWAESKMISMNDFHGKTPCQLRYMNNLPKIPNAGWHFSYQGGIDAIIKKLESFAHQEYNKPEIINRERIEKLVNEGVDIFGQNLKCKIVPIDDSYPKYIRENLEKFKEMIKII